MTSRMRYGEYLSVSELAKEMGVPINEIASFAIEHKLSFVGGLLSAEEFRTQWQAHRAS